MRRRRVYLILGVLGVVLAGFLVAVFRREREPEPEYGGKRLSEWVEKMPYGPVTYQDFGAERAIRLIGTNGLPCLLKWIRYSMPSWKNKLYEAVNPTLNRLNSAWELYDKKQRRKGSAIVAFGVLGPQARPAIPELTLMLNELKKTDNAITAAYALALLGSDGLPPLLAALTNQQQPPMLRFEVAVELGYRSASTQAWVRVFNDLLTDSNALVREGATNALENIDRRALAMKRRADQEPSNMK